jgi:mannose-6-phosphate isomerase-like protein (cupin superfamily)
MPMRKIRIAVILLCLVALSSGRGEERRVDPTFLHRFVPDLQEKPSDLTTPTCHYKPIFGAGDSDTSVVRGVARYGEMKLDPGGSTALVNYPAEEQVYVILEGSGVLKYGDQDVPVRKNDFMYLPPGIRHGLANPSSTPCRAIVMGFKIPAGTSVTPPEKVLLANVDDVKKQTLSSHPSSTLYRLLIGPASTEERYTLVAGQVLTSLFLMEFLPGGTNFPHHHEREEEIYLVLDGHGDIVAGGGLDGIEGRHPAQAGDAYFFRLNCTVGFYSRTQPGDPLAHILAVRSLFPGMARRRE